MSVYVCFIHCVGNLSFSTCSTTETALANAWKQDKLQWQGYLSHCLENIRTKEDKGIDTSPLCAGQNKATTTETGNTALPCVQRKQKQFQTICMHPVHACATSPLNLPHNALEPMPMGTLPLRYFMPLPLDLTLPLLGTTLLCPFPFPCPCLAPPMQRLPLPLRLAGGGPAGG